MRQRFIFPRLLVALSLLALVLTGCTSARHYHQSTTTTSYPCRIPNLRPDTPMVCIDDTHSDVLAANPETIEVFDTDPADRVSPVTIQWFTASGTGALRIQAEPGCGEAEVFCPGDGHCRVKTKKLDAEATYKKCKYDVWIEGGTQKKLDPYIVVRPCCV